MSAEQTNKKTQKRPKMPLRAQQLALTKTRIITALSELIETTHPTDVTMAAVAAHAGVSEPTLYRHFATKKKLFTALGEELYKQSTRKAPPTNLEELIAFFPALYGFMSENEAVLRWNLTAPKDEAIRPPVEDPLNLLSSVLSSQLENTPKDEAQHILRAMLLLTSPMGFLYWQDYLGLSADQSAETAAWMTQKLMEE